VFVNPVKTAEPIEMPFCGLGQVSPRNHVLDGGADPQGERAIFGGCLPHWKALKVFTVVYTKKAEPIEMLFGD